MNEREAQAEIGNKRLTAERRLTDLTVRGWLSAGLTPSLHDGGGLYLRRRAGGAFWSLRQVNPDTGARIWAALFMPSIPYPKATIRAAREKADAARLAAMEGQDAVRLRQRQRNEKKVAAVAAALLASRRISVRALFDRWQAAELAPQRRADGTRTGRKDAGQWVKDSFERRLFPVLGAVPAEDVKKSDLLAILDECKGSGQRRTANVLLADLKQMFRFAADRDIVAVNPLASIKRDSVGGKDVARDRVLSYAELSALAAAVEQAGMSPRSVAALWLILATACRIGEAMTARWAHVDMTARMWHLPETKNERTHDIHLSDFAVRQFDSLLAMREAGPDGAPVPWVFPNVTGDGPVCVKSFGKQLADRQRPPERRITGRSTRTASLVLAGGRWTAHDLRRTAATTMAEFGVSGDVIDECLNHKIESRVRRTYIRDRRLTDQARAFALLGARLETLIA